MHTKIDIAVELRKESQQAVKMITPSKKVGEMLAPLLQFELLHHHIRAIYFSCFVTS
jgi:hypothetical protein